MCELSFVQHVIP